jgi:hypothetical protein
LIDRLLARQLLTIAAPVSGRIAEDRSSCELIAKEEGAVQQLVLMALSESPVVVRQACKTIGAQPPTAPLALKTSLLKYHIVGVP